MTSIIPQLNDVLFTKDYNLKPNTSHSSGGNQQFQLLINTQKHNFLSNINNHKEQCNIINNIIQYIQGLNPPGRFLIEVDAANNVWTCIDYEKIFSIVMQLLFEDLDTSNNNNVVGGLSGGAEMQYPNTSNNTVPTSYNTNPPGLQQQPASGQGQQEDYTSLQQQHDILQMQIQQLQQKMLQHQQQHGTTDNSMMPSQSSQPQMSHINMSSNQPSTQPRMASGVSTNVSCSKNKECSDSISLLQWIERSKLKFAKDMATSTNSSNEYIKSAILIALMIIDHIIESEEKENESIPLASLVTKNVFFYLMPDFVWIMNSSSVGGNSDIGTVQSRKFAVGVILYELFSADQEPLLEDMPSFTNAPSSFTQGIDLNTNTNVPSESKHHPDANRPQKRLSTAGEGDKISNCIVKLEGKGAPRSICTLVKNLLDCSKGDYCEDDAYSSFADLRQDLTLMVEDPSCYLDDIQVTSSLPTLVICDKLYGRQDEETRLGGLYQQYISEKTSRGVIISGGAGVGKSRLALHALRLTSESNGLFCSAKFEQNQLNSKPLQAVGELFNALCDVFVEGATPNDLLLVEYELQASLGNQAGLLMGVVPNLMKLLPSSWRQLLGTSSGGCVDIAVSMRYLFGELLRIISSHSKRPISLFMDDIQFADEASLLLISQLLISAKACSGGGFFPAFFIFCHRDDEDYRNTPFGVWLSSLSIFSLDSVVLGDLSVESVNSLVSETLHLSPRITRPLSAVVHHKSRGNPLFLTQLLGSLHGQGYIYIDLTLSRWAWNMEKIAQEPVSPSVIALLTKEMKRLHADLQLGLGVVSCLGSSIQKDALDILSKDLNVDLFDILNQVSKKGFMDKLDDGAKFRFAHDKIQEAAYELQSKEHRRKDHLRYGLAIYFDISGDDSSGESNQQQLFFTSITQINHGGPDIVDDPHKKSMIAGLNLKAGRLSIALSDYTTAFTLFEHGISYLGDDKWTSQYELSIDLFDSAAEAACVLNKRSVVNSRVEEVVAHAKCFDDSLNCLSVAAKVLQNTDQFKESMESILDILTKLGEDIPRPMGDSALITDIDAMNKVLHDRSDDSLFNIQYTKDKKLVALHQLYSDLIQVIYFIKPALFGSVSLRMIELTMSKGITPTAPIAFAYYGTTLAAMGKVEEGCRLGRLAVKLVEKNALSSKYKPMVILIAYQTILWRSEPLQSTAEAHYKGYIAGQQLGDFKSSWWNSHTSLIMNYLTGHDLCTFQATIKQDYTKMIQDEEQSFVFVYILLHSQVVALRQGLHTLNAGRVEKLIPSEAELLAQENINKHIQMSSKINKLERSILFQQFSSNLLDDTNISGTIAEMKMQLRPLLCIGVFLEGLACYMLSHMCPVIKATIARGEVSQTKTKLIERGRSVLTRIRSLAEHSSWNWENKVLLLEAMEMHTMGNLDAAGPLYTSSIRSAREHKFIHEEAIASELAGEYLYERGNHLDAYALFMHSIKCFKEWGADAVAKRVETSVQTKFDTNVSHLQAIDVNDTMKRILSLDDQQQKKRSLVGLE